MPKHLIRATHTVEGLKGLLKEGGSNRRKAIAQSAEAVGGKLENMYYAFGDTDLFVILDLPDNVTATTASLVSNIPGMSKNSITVLITPEEVDQAVDLAKEKMAAYRPPGQ
jgi:uncharacterized protein with GYD domain